MLGADVWEETAVGCRATGTGHAGPAWPGRAAFSGKEMGNKLYHQVAFFSLRFPGFGKRGCLDGVVRVLLESWMCPRLLPGT